MSEPRTAYRDERGHTHRHPTGSPFYHDECDITDAPERGAATPLLDVDTASLIERACQLLAFVGNYGPDAGYFRKDADEWLVRARARLAQQDGTGE